MIHSDYYDLIKALTKYVIAFFYSLWSAVVSIAWGFASFLLLAGLMKSYNQPVPPELIGVIGVLSQKWLWFFVVFLVYNLIVNYKEITK